MHEAMCMWGTGSRPLQGVWGTDSGPCGVRGAPALGLCSEADEHSMCGGPVGAPTGTKEWGASSGWLRDTYFGSPGIKGLFACQSYGPSGPRNL